MRGDNLEERQDAKRVGKACVKYRLSSRDGEASHRNPGTTQKEVKTMEKPISYATKIGRKTINEELEIGEHLKAFEQSGGSENPSLHNWMIVVSKYVAGQQQIIAELVARVEALESK